MSTTIPVRQTRLPRLRAQVEATTLATLVYAASARFPEIERVSLGDQMRRAATSVPSNIAEGCARPTRADRARILGIAWGSLRELEVQIDVATGASLLDRATSETLRKHCRWTGRLLYALIRSPMR